MKNSLEALTHALRTLHKTKDGGSSTTSFDVNNRHSPVATQTILNPTEEISEAERSYQAMLRNELNELKDFFIDVSSAKSRVEEKVKKLENPCGAPTAMSTEKQFQEDSNVRARAMVS